MKAIFILILLIGSAGYEVRFQYLQLRLLLPHVSTQHTAAPVDREYDSV
jgi:hypothetical protein